MVEDLNTEWWTCQVQSVHNVSKGYRLTHTHIQEVNALHFWSNQHYCTELLYDNPSVVVYQAVTSRPAGSRDTT